MSLESTKYRVWLPLPPPGAIGDLWDDTDELDDLQIQDPGLMYWTLLWALCPQT